MFVIANFVSPVAEKITQPQDQVKMILISQLIKNISRVLQKLLKCFNGAAILIPFVLLAEGVFPVIFILENLLCYHSAHLSNIDINSQMFLNNYCCILLNHTSYIGVTASRSLALSTWVLFTLLI